MRATWGALAILLATPSSISYFKYQREIGPLGATGQHYAVLDEAVWEGALPNLDDVRLYAAGHEIPYISKTMSGSKQTEERTIRLLQPGILRGKTQFVLDMEGVPEYDRVKLTLTTKNYVAHARVEGQDDLHGPRWTNLGTTTLFDLSGEKLGRNSTLQVPVSTYKYLRVTLDGPVKPFDLQSATAGIERAQEAEWRDLSSTPQEIREGKDTVLTFTVSRNLPVDRLVLDIDPAQGNFQREIELQDVDGSTTAVGQISRIHMQRNGGRIDVEQLWISVGVRGQGKLRAVIRNGDDAPLKIARARLQQYERRLYFDCPAETSVELYYGDDKLDAPVYDYAKLFQMDANAEHVQVGAEENNAAYSGRPDDRPWSERHPAVLWTAILAAVALLGGIAVRSVKTAAS